MLCGVDLISFKTGSGLAMMYFGIMILRFN